MSDKLRLLVARVGRGAGAEGEEVMELDSASLPVTRIGGRGKLLLPNGRRFAAVLPPPIALVDWEKVPDKPAPPNAHVGTESHDNDGPTVFWLCTECALMVERAESEPLPEGDCKHEWIPLDV